MSMSHFNQTSDISNNLEINEIHVNNTIYIIIVWRRFNNSGKSFFYMPRYLAISYAVISPDK